MPSIRKAKEKNIPQLVDWVNKGWDIVTPIPSCTLMFNQELPLMFPDDEVETIERCSGHDGTYAVKKEFHDISKKIARPVMSKVNKGDAQHFVSDSPMAAEQIAQGLDKHEAESPLGLLRKAYGI